MSIRVHNTLSRKTEELVTLVPGEVRMYVCGITAYDLSHIGHARSAIVFDVIRRYLTFKGYRVRFVKNFTDVDDKIIKRANAEGVPAREISERYIAEFYRDMEAIGVLRGDVEPKATDHVDRMITLIEQLIAGGFAYVIDGDVYFEIRRFPPYGRLSGKNLDELLAGARVDVDERKRDPRDFALWKAAKPGEPSWSSPWGDGRPGWHIECSAMSMEYLGPTFDIHGGGEDLIFPHHECEIAQSEAGTGTMFAHYWIHNGFVNLGAEKMSKSLGNTLLIRELVKRHDADALRLWLLGTHYRHPIEFAEDRLAEAGRALERLKDPVREAGRLSPGTTIESFSQEAGETGTQFLSRIFSGIQDGSAEKPIFGTLMQRFEEAMDADFNTPEAIAAIFSLSRELRMLRNRVDDSTEAAASYVYGARLLLTLGRILGLLERRVEVTGPPPDVERLVTERTQARARRDWRRSDELREAIAKLGWSVEDTAAGPRLTPRR